MTPDKRAQALWDTFESGGIPLDRGPFVERIATVIREAVALEREACARVAEAMAKLDEFDEMGYRASVAIATAIRAGSEP